MKNKSRGQSHGGTFFVTLRWFYCSGMTHSLEQQLQGLLKTHKHARTHTHTPKSGLFYRGLWPSKWNFTAHHGVLTQGLKATVLENSHLRQDPSLPSQRLTFFIHIQSSLPHHTFAQVVTGKPSVLSSRSSRFTVLRTSSIITEARVLKSEKIENNIRTVRDTFILHFQVLIRSWARVRKDVWASNHCALRPVATPERQRRRSWVKMEAPGRGRARRWIQDQVNIWRKLLPSTELRVHI